MMHYPVKECLAYIGMLNQIFTFQISVKNKPPTRRGILSIVSSVYDPLGFIPPFVLTAKIILQKLCSDKVGWDEEISGDNLIFWNKWLKDLPHLEEFAVQRYLLPSEFGNVVRSQLHHFSDASETGYGTVSYLHSVNDNEEAHCSFVMGKSRLAPLKRITTP